MTTPTPKEVQRYDFDGDYGHCGCSIRENNDGDYVLYADCLALAAGRDAAESLVSAQHDALVAMKNERDWWEHRAEVAERENGEALSMLAFTGEPSSLWQAAAAARAKLYALTAHMNQVHETLGGSDTVLTLDAAQHVVAKLAEAKRERGDADDALAACQAQAAGTIARLREALDKWEDSALNLLAVVHRDGGQHTATVGFAASCTEAEAVVVALRAKLDAIREEAQTTIDLYNNNGPEWTSLQSGEEYYSASSVLGKAQAILDHARTAATEQGE
jgi:hypothetical protein